MRVLLIALPNDGMKWVPLNLLYLAGTLDDAGIDVKIVDQNVVGLGGVFAEIKKQYDVIGMSVLTHTRWDAFDWANIIRFVSPKTKIVMGGVHATIMPEQCQRFSDVVIKGDGESPFLDVCQGHDPIEKILPIDSLHPAWHKINLWSYPGKGLTTHDQRKVNGVDIFNLPRISIQSSRSCNSHCRFCSSFWVQGAYRMRSPKNIVFEMEYLYRRGMRSFYFIDDSFLLDKAKCLEFCQELKDSDIRIAFRIQTRADVLDEEYVEALASVGCYYVAIGVETGSERILGAMHKSTNVSAAETAIKTCKKYGVRTEALMIVGNEGETDETIEDTRRFLKRVKPTVVGSGKKGLWIFPGTAVYNKAKKEGLISDDFWETRGSAKTYRFSQEQIDKWNRRVFTYSFISWLRYWFDKLERRIR